MPNVRFIVSLVLFISFALNVVLLGLIENPKVWKPPTQHTPNTLSHTISFPNVPRIKWDYDDPLFIQNLLNKSEPVIMTDTPASNWPAMRHWSFQYFIGLLGRDMVLNGVWHTKEPVIYRTNDDYEWPGVEQKYDKLSMKLEEFIHKMKHTELYDYHYFSGDVKLTDKCLAKLANDIEPEEICPSYAIDIDNNLWLGSPGVTSQCHYDFSQNFYVQIRGQKQFILTPPYKIETLRPFPIAHPYGRRSHNNYTALTPEDARNMAAEGVMEANLQRGDVLYIPSFWAHHVSNVDGAISLNVWFRTPVQLAMLRNLEAMPVNHVSTQDAKNYVLKTLQSLFDVLDIDIRGWMKHHFKLRYKPIFEKYLNSTENPELEKECSDTPLSAKMEIASEKQVNMFLDVWKDVPLTWRPLHLGDFVDSFVYKHMDPPQTLYFIKYCLIKNET